MKWSTIRDISLFFGGFTGVTVLTAAWLKGHDPNAQLMLMFGSMMGLPAFLRKDEKE